jgi:chromosome segregation ATPase
MRTRFLSCIVVLAVAALSSVGAHAQSETDRLRDALRSATAQTRSLEDQRTVLQAKLAEADREKVVLKAQIDAAKADLRQAEKQQRESVDEFNQRLAERDQTLEKWKAAYEEAATVARSKDAERAKFEGEATAYKASTKSCQAKNTQLVKVGRELLQRYEGVTVGETIVTREPLIGLRRVEIQNLLQDYNDKILDQKVTP